MSTIFYTRDGNETDAVFTQTKGFLADSSRAYAVVKSGYSKPSNSYYHEFEMIVGPDVSVPPSTMHRASDQHGPVEIYYDPSTNAIKARLYPIPPVTTAPLIMPPDVLFRIPTGEITGLKVYQTYVRVPNGTDFWLYFECTYYRAGEATYELYADARDLGGSYFTEFFGAASMDTFEMDPGFSGSVVLDTGLSPSQAAEVSNYVQERVDEAVVPEVLGSTDFQEGVTKQVRDTSTRMFVSC